MSFETHTRNAAIAPADIDTVFTALSAQYGAYLPDGDQVVRTIGAHWDDTAHTRKRAASLTAGTITGQPLTDGRVAFRCLWQTDLVAAFLNGDVPEVEELTDEELQNLLPEPDPEP